MGLKAKKIAGIVFDVFFLIVIVFTAIFIPLYLRAPRAITELAYLEIESIECTDELESGSYTLKISLFNRRSYKTISTDLLGEQKWNQNLNFSIRKEFKNRHDRYIFNIYLKLQKNMKTSIIKWEFSDNFVDPSSLTFWFNKFGGDIKITFSYSHVW
jgi:hypothetical protein